MPFYDLKCNHCQTEHNIMASMADKENKKIACPGCGSHDMTTVFKAAPYVLKQRETASGCPHSAACGHSCPHAQ